MRTSLLQPLTNHEPIQWMAIAITLPYQRNTFDSIWMAIMAAKSLRFNLIIVLWFTCFCPAHTSVQTSIQSRHSSAANVIVFPMVEDLRVAEKKTIQDGADPIPTGVKPSIEVGLYFQYFDNSITNRISGAHWRGMQVDETASQIQRRVGGGFKWFEWLRCEFWLLRESSALINHQWANQAFDCSGTTELTRNLHRKFFSSSISATHWAERQFYQRINNRDEALLTFRITVRVSNECHH